MANILQSLVHTERNQQVMCEAGLHARLLQRCGAALADEDHSLHPPLQRMFERLASQALEPMVLRSVRPSWYLCKSGKAVLGVFALWSDPVAKAHSLRYSGSQTGGS